MVAIHVQTLPIDVNGVVLHNNLICFSLLRFICRRYNYKASTPKTFIQYSIIFPLKQLHSHNETIWKVRETISRNVNQISWSDNSSSVVQNRRFVVYCKIVIATLAAQRGRLMLL